jgi:succinate dehydrogenase/fumarate reductase flavoprotein subunit
MKEMAMKVWNGGLDRPHDVVVVGSGAGGLTAALTAATSGAAVAVLDKGPYIGGTTAVSGGMIWIPSNLRMQEQGIADSDDAALRYLERVAGGRTPMDQLRAIVEFGRVMQAFVEAESPLRFSTLPGFPDYHPDWDGAHGGGRSMEADLFDASSMGDLFDALRPDHRPPFTMAEYEEWRIFTRFPWEELQHRASQGFVARGRALIAPLLQACVEAGVTVITDLAVERLIGSSETGVLGVRTSAGEIRCETVILACGGFEWNLEMCAQFLAGEVRGSCSPPHNTGDGIRMASALGAKLGNMTEAWWGPMVQLPEDVTDGAPTSTLLRFERTGPHSIMVDRHGRRFLNEAHNYNDVTKVLHAFDPRDYGPVHLPVHLVFDQHHLEEYGFLSHRAGQATPGWLIEAPTIAELARRIGIDADALHETVERFNTFARRGEDPDWHRGENAYDRYWGDLEAPHPALGPVETGPFYAIEVFSGVIGTKGGVATNARGQVIDVWDEPIRGLFATGNTTAHPMGVGYAGAGSTLGPAMTVGWLAAHTACGAVVRP